MCPGPRLQWKLDGRVSTRCRWKHGATGDFHVKQEMQINLAGGGFPGGLNGKETPAMKETWVQSLGWENPLGKGMATYSSFWPGEFP